MKKLSRRLTPLQARRDTPKKMRAIQTSRHLHVVQRQHTGHLTHRRTTSYPTLAMIVLCVGVFLATWTHFVGADSFIYPDPVTNSYTVHASVPGPAPTVAAVIHTPGNGARFVSQPIVVSGTCPDDTYVTVYRNGAFSGVALCQADDSWSLQAALFPGVNQLQARVFSPTDVPGPLSDLVTVTYQPPVVAPPANGDSSGSTASTGSGGSQTTSGGQAANSASAAVQEPLIFKTNFSYRGHYVGEPSGWQLGIEGGTAPYAIAVDWGDGTHGLISRPRAGGFTLEHIYKQAGGYKGSYPVKFSATDADGGQTFLQLMTIVNNPPASAAARTASGSSGDPTPNYLKPILHYVWPGYGILVLMLTSFWLGERREYRYLKPRLKKARHA